MPRSPLPPAPAPAAGAPARAQVKVRLTVSGPASPAATKLVTAHSTPLVADRPLPGAATLVKAVPASDPADQAIEIARKLGEQGRYHQAEQVLLKAMAQDQGSVPLRRYLAAVFLALAKHREALSLLQPLVESFPEDQGLLLNLSTAWFKLQNLHEAHKALEYLVRRFPSNTQARVNLASIHLNNLENPQKALEVLLPAAAESHAGLHFGLGCVYGKLGDVEQALLHYERSLAIQPGHAESLSNYLFSLHYRYPVDLVRVREISERNGQALFNQAQRLGQVLAPPAPRPVGRRLRVGILSADLRLHPVGHFLETVLQALSQREVDLLAYANQGSNAMVPPRIKAVFKQWRDVLEETDQSVAETMAADNLDVLLDLSGHTTGNRIGVLMRRPARRQVSWLGYFGTTGLPFMDAVIADPHCVPPEETRYFSETVLHMPRSRLCLTPPADAPPIAPEPPMASLQYITFGCFQNVNKINDTVLALWGRLLKAVPASVLRLQSLRMDGAEPVVRMRERLKVAGIDLKRVWIGHTLPRQAYLEQYGEVDVLLDTFPYPGGTTTAEAIWMGVPTLSLATPGMLGRQGQAMLDNVGLGDWVAHSEAEYLEMASALAQDRTASVERLRAIRRDLREVARRSPLFDAERFAKDFEHLLRTYCTQATD